MKLGTPEISLNVKNLDASTKFYTAFGFRKVEGDEEEGWLVLQQDGIRIGLYQGHVSDNSISFFGGDVAAISNSLTDAGIQLTDGPARESDGSIGANIYDPDGNRIYLNS